MHALRIIFSLCIVVGFLTAPSLAAIETTARTEVRFMSWETDQSGLFVTENGRDYSAISAPAYSFGATVSIKADAALRIYKRTEGPKGPVYVVVGETSLPPGSRVVQVYLVSQAEKLTANDYRLIAMSNDPTAFAVGQVRVFNFSPLEAAVKIGNESVRLRPLEWRTMAAVPDRKHRVMIFAALQTGDNEWTPGTRDMVTIRENYRGNVTLIHTRMRFDENGPLPPAESARMLIRTSNEYVNPLEISVTALSRR